jgi:hypothetical protein
MSDVDFSNFKREGLVGIAPASFIQQRIEAIRTRAYDPPDDDPVVWVRSKEELQRILKNPNHCLHNKVLRAANGQDVRCSKAEARAMVRKPYPHVDPDQADCVHRLMMILEEMTKEYPKRRAFVRRIVQEDTKFSLESVYVGRADPRGRWLVRSAHPVGLAALDPWFHDRGLSPSIIIRPGKPPEPDSLDPMGVLVRTRRSTWQRHPIFHVAVYQLFGIDEGHWPEICDVQQYPRLERGPGDVLEKLRTLTHNTHAAKFTGAANPS